MKKLFLITLALIMITASGVFAQSNDSLQTIRFALDATNSGTTTQLGGGVSTMVVMTSEGNQYTGPLRLIKSGTLRAENIIYDDSILVGLLNKDGYISVTIEEMAASDAAIALGNYSGATFTLTAEFTDINDADHWANPDSITVFNGVALSGATPQPTRIYPDWGSDFMRWRLTTGGSTQFQTVKIKQETR